MGWTGHLVLHLFYVDREVFYSFANWAARPPHQWRYKRTGEIAARLLTGWIIGTTGKARPISAPTFVRRVGAAALMRIARPFVERYCRARGQFGLSSESHQIMYSLLPTSYLKLGGTVVLADRSKSFVSIRRDAVLEAFRDLFATAGDEDQNAVRALSMAFTDYYVSGSVDAGYFDVPQVNFATCEETIPVYGLPQGCSTSPTIEAVVLAYFHSRHTTTGNSAGSLPPVVSLGNHDDLVVAALPGHVDRITLPDCSRVGGAQKSPLPSDLKQAL